jgi:hypothetical protein
LLVSKRPDWQAPAPVLAQIAEVPVEDDVERNLGLDERLLEQKGVEEAVRGIELHRGERAQHGRVRNALRIGKIFCVGVEEVDIGLAPGVTVTPSCDRAHHAGSCRCKPSSASNSGGLSGDAIPPV